MTNAPGTGGQEHETRHDYGDGTVAFQRACPDCDRGLLVAPARFCQRCEGSGYLVPWVTEPDDGTHLDGPCGDHLCPFCRVRWVPRDPNPFPIMRLWPCGLGCRVVFLVHLVLGWGFVAYDVANERWAWLLIQVPVSCFPLACWAWVVRQERRILARGRPGRFVAWGVDRLGRHRRALARPSL
jgi:hypothetical protein